MHKSINSGSLIITDNIRFVLLEITSNNLRITGKCLKVS